MKAVMCPNCGVPMKRNGKTTAGTQRWRCKACGLSRTVSYDNTPARLQEFLSWLLSKETQLSMPGEGRSFRRRTAEFWQVWPMPTPTGELHRVLYVDGIWLARNLVVLIAHDGSYVVSWYMAESETSRAGRALIESIPAPDMVVCDGGSGFAKTMRSAWPRTRVQRCLFHAYTQVKRYTTSRPKLQAGRELYALAIDLMHLETLHQADWWIEHYLSWCELWADFLEETLLTKKEPLPRTNNPIEGGVNALLRDILRNHRGMSLMRRVKAVFWWCYLHTECPLPAKDILSSMPTDADIDFLYKTYSVQPKRDDGGPEWGDRVVWEELHHKDPYPFWLD